MVVSAKKRRRKKVHRSKKPEDHSGWQRARRGHGQGNLADRAFERLEEMIVTLALAPESTLSEETLSKQLGIGRTPIREALKRLEQQRLVFSVPRKGLIVRGMNIGEHLALLEILRPLDRLIASKAARWATPNQRVALQQTAAEMKRAAREGDMHGYLNADHECDRIVYDAARNQFAIDAVAPLYSHSRRFWYFYRHDTDMVQAAQLHGELMSAIADGNPEAAAEASDRLIDHLEEFSRTVLGMS